MVKKPPTPPGENSGCDILHVEDDQDDRMLTREALQDLGFTGGLVEAKDGDEALRLLRTLPGSRMPALVLLDINLPKLRGHEVLQAIRADAKTKRIPVVMLTSSDSEADVSRSYDLGANGYVVKPVGFESFSKAIESLAAFWLKVNRRPLAAVEAP